jgi:DNA-binding transcriptional ArsR family regulator
MCNVNTSTCHSEVAKRPKNLTQDWLREEPGDPSSSLSLRVRVTDRNKTDMEERLVWDLLPEEFPYEDKGCELYPSCLDCPFPGCLREEPWGKERFLKRRRAQRMLELRHEGKSIREIARIFEVSPRTVQRWLKAITSQESKVGGDN